MQIRSPHLCRVVCSSIINRRSRFLQVLYFYLNQLIEMFAPENEVAINFSDCAEMCNCLKTLA